MLGNEGMNGLILQTIFKMLDSAQIEYRHLEHEPTQTSEDSARVRGESTKIGGKALLVKAGKGERARFVLFVISAALQLDSVKSRKAMGVQRSRFATRDELAELTGGLVPGSVPPFGDPILPGIELYVDESVLQNERIAFNAGSLTDSIIMQVEDYRRVAVMTGIVNVTRLINESKS